MATNAASDRPIIIRRIKKVQGGHHGGAWKVAYADFVTAMMAFFMLLWLVSNPDKAMLKGLADYFTVTPLHAQSSGATNGAAGMGAGQGRQAMANRQKANGVPAMESATAGTARGGTANVPDAALRVMAEELRVSMTSTADGENAADNVRFEETPAGIRINLMDTARRSMFKPGTAVLNDFARNLLARIAAKAQGSRVQLSIEGHTDATGGQSDANWALSGARADAARRALQAAGLTPDRFQGVVAKAGSAPVYPDEPERPENRRITVVLLAEGSPLPPTTNFRLGN